MSTNRIAEVAPESKVWQSTDWDSMECALQKLSTAMGNPAVPYDKDKPAEVALVEYAAEQVLLWRGAWIERSCAKEGRS